MKSRLAVNGKPRKKLSSRVVPRSTKQQMTVREAANVLMVDPTSIYNRINRRWPPITVIQKCPGGEIRLLVSDVRRIQEHGWYPSEAAQ